MTWSLGVKGDGARCAPSWRLRADWIPAYAGMTASRLRGQGTARGGATRSYGKMEVTISITLACVSWSSVRPQTTATSQARRAAMPSRISLPA